MKLYLAEENIKHFFEQILVIEVFGWGGNDFY